MANTIQTGNDYSYLFNNASSGSSGTNLFSNVGSSSGYSLADYASIKSGSYKKLLKSYYAKQESDKSTSSTSTAASTNTSKVRTDVNTLKNATDVLSATGKDSLFQKVSKTDKDGNTTSDYDMDNIYSNVKKFVDGYNAVIKSAGESENKSILRNTLSMIRQTSVSSNLLSDIGISVGKDNTLSIDETTFKKSSVSTMQTLFSGHASYADAIGSYASRIDHYAETEAKKNGTYTASGSYATSSATGSTGSILDDYL